MNRIFEHKRVWKLNNDVYQIAAQNIGEVVKQSYNIDVVIGILEGGRKLSEDIANELGCSLVQIDAKNNISDTLYSVPKPEVIIGDTNHVPNLDGKSILIVDDICGTGQTIKTIHKTLSIKNNLNNFICATLCLNEGSEFTPDIYIWKVRDWVLFPWEHYVDNVNYEILDNPIIIRKT